MKNNRQESRIGSGMPGPGRTPGVPNRVTQEVRQAFAELVAGNQHRLQALFDRVATDDPGRALELFLRLSEYVIPKPARLVEPVEETPQLVIQINLGDKVREAEKPKSLPSLPVWDRDAR